VLVVCAAAPVNMHDSVLFPQALLQLTETAQRLGLTLTGIPLTLDSGFDSKDNEQLITGTGMVPVIKPNFRNTKDSKLIEQRTKEFKMLEVTYQLRHTVERGFAWEDKYRKLVTRYERLKETFDGCRYLAAAMVNYRAVFGKVL
jgi:Transposase DDE domain